MEGILISILQMRKLRLEEINFSKAKRIERAIIGIRIWALLSSKHSSLPRPRSKVHSLPTMCEAGRDRLTPAPESQVQASPPLLVPGHQVTYSGPGGTVNTMEISKCLLYLFIYFCFLWGASYQTPAHHSTLPGGPPCFSYTKIQRKAKTDR